MRSRGPSTWPRVVCTAVVLALSASVLAGCSSGGPSSSSTPGSNATAPTTGAVATTAAGGGVPTSCPPASVVNAALGESGGPPTVTQESYGISCAYPGTGAVPTKIDFQQDTASTFAAGENAVPTATKVSGLGDAAYVAGGFLAVLNGTYSIKILSAFSTPKQLEALAHQLLA